ncbi:MAG: hypothetical protein JWO80_5359, partial [Bryobacterales bacterium]|nr:hypothetical protein [Bryobacterales bacterium]
MTIPGANSRITCVPIKKLLAPRCSFAAGAVCAALLIPDLLSAALAHLTVQADAASHAVPVLVTGAPPSTRIEFF